MTWLCDLALAAGLTLSGSCPGAAPAPDPLPADDPAVWAYKPPAPPPAPAPAPAPAFPPVVIEREVVREVAIPAPVQAPPPAPAPKTLGPVERSVQSAYRSRTLGSAAWTPPEALPVSVDPARIGRPAPLDLGIAAKDQAY
ncbi:conjugation TrbI-like protein, partial [Magnetospirillum fulvum MGU-K5]